MSNELKQCSTCKIYENGTCWKKAIKREDYHVKDTDSCKNGYVLNPNANVVTPSKQAPPIVANNAPIDKEDSKTSDTNKSSTTVTK